MLLTLRRSGARAVLAISAVALAIAAMMLMFALSAGADQQLRAINDQLGRNLLGISAAEIAAPPGRPQGWFISPRLKWRDVDALHSIGTVVPVVELSSTASFQRLAITTTVRGVTPDFLRVRNFRVQDGRAIDDRDDATRSRVALVGSYISRKLNGGFTLVGETIWIGRVPFEVVGELAAKGSSSEGLNEDDQIVIPLSTAMRRLVNTDSFSRLVVQLGNERDLEPAQPAIRDVLRASHRLDDDVKDDFRVLSLIRANEIRRRNSDFLQGLATIFAAVTLAIGGAGVLSVTFLNVRERIPEIGLRIAIGARPRDITQLFVAEACVLSIAGGIAGLVIGRAGIALLVRSIGWTMAVDLRAVVAPFVISVLLGIVFSVLPAIRAASVMPVEALREQ